MAPTVTITDRRGGTRLDAQLGAGVPKPSGDTGWEVVERPKRKGFPDWRQQPLGTLTLPLMFDGLAAGSSVELYVALLRRMAASDDVQRPPTVKISGPVPDTHLIWVIESIEWGDSDRAPDGTLVRQLFDLQLLEWQDGDVVKLRSAKVFRDRHQRSSIRSYSVVQTVKGPTGARGETLMQVVVRVLGDTGKWREVAKLNHITDPRRPLKVGRKVRFA